MKLEHTITPCTEVNSKCLKDLNIRHDTITLLGESISHANVYSGQSPKATEMKTKINKQDFIKLANSSIAKKTIKK